jgi:hypothetical protein
MGDDIGIIFRAVIVVVIIIGVIVLYCLFFL